MTTQQVYIRAAHLALCGIPNLTSLAYVGDQSNNEIKNLPSWVPDLSIMQWPVPFEFSKTKFSAANRDRWVPDWNDDVLILHGHLLDLVALTSETQVEIRSGEGIFRMLQIFLESGSFYKQHIGVTIFKLFVTDGLDPIQLHEISTMDKKYNVKASFEKILFTLICFALHAAGQKATLEMQAAYFKIDRNLKSNPTVVREADCIRSLVKYAL